MDELRRNGSGYYDPTAYKALKKIEREENEMEVRKGEIWEVEMGSSLRTVVVIATHGIYSTILVLNDEHRAERTIQINAQGMKCAEPGKISFRFHEDFNKFIRLTTEKEFADIINQVADALGIEKEPLFQEEIPFGIAESKEIQRLQEELAAAEERNIKHIKRNEELVEERLHISVELEALMKERNDAMKAIIERDLYKSQYESLLERVIAKAV